MNIACVQFDPQLGDWTGNVARVERLLQQAGLAAGDLDVLLLPEMAFIGYCFRDTAEILPATETVPGGPTLSWCRQTALRLGCYVACGFAERAGATLYNSQAIVDRQGTLVHVHRKNFLYQTDETWASEGGKFTCLDLPGLGACSFAICMDLNPKAFKAPWDAYEFASSLLDPPRRRGDTKQAYRLRANLVLVSTAWLWPQGEELLTSAQRGTYLMNYWASRMQPVLGRPVVFALANRVGLERGIRFAGTSCVIDLQRRLVLGHLGESEEGILVTRGVG